MIKKKHWVRAILSEEGEEGKSKLQPSLSEEGRPHKAPTMAAAASVASDKKKQSVAMRSTPSSSANAGEEK